MQNKTCTKCGLDKPLVDFPKSNRFKCGYEAECRACRSVRRRRRYAADSATRERSKAYTKARRALHKDDAYRLAYRQAYKLVNREKMRARRSVRKAVARGKILPATSLQCVKCGGKASEYHHHRGYSMENRLQVVPVCSSCHGIENRKAL